MIVPVLPMASRFLSHSIRIHRLAVKKHFRLFSLLLSILHDVQQGEPFIFLGVFTKVPFLESRFILRFAIAGFSMIFFHTFRVGMGYREFTSLKSRRSPP